MGHRFSLVYWACLSTLLFVGGLRAEAPVKLMTYNIRFANPADGPDVWENRSTTVIATIQQADIVGLQEVLLQQLQDIQTATADDFEWYGIGRDDGREQGEMSPIGWRKKLFRCDDRGTFWLSENPQAIGEKSWDAALPRIASWVRLTRLSDGSQVLVANTHFDHRGREARRQSARLLREWVAKNRQGMPAILLGDFNAQIDDAPMLELLEPDKQEAPPLVDAMLVSQSPPTGPNSTWNAFRAIDDGRRIDHILISGEVTVVDFSTLDPRTQENRFASDHMPVVMTATY
jgi:endonuclease/exonuclease/phosphatase family metal-dependent hydrolase